MKQIFHQDEYIHASLDDLWFKLRRVELIHDGWIERQLIESHVLFIVKHGNGHLTIDFQEYRLRQEAIHIALPGQTIGATKETGGRLDLYMIQFDVFRDSNLEEAFHLKGEIPIYPDTQTVMLNDFIYYNSRSTNPLERFRGQSAFQELLYWMMKNIRNQPESDPRTALDRTKAFIDSHYNENLTIEQLARIAEISPKYYVDLFKKTYGKSAIDYVTEVRVNHAKRLMVQSTAKLRDIAHQVGYSDEFYFSRKFKKQVGVSPTAYMKNRRRKIVAYESSILGQLLALNMIPYAAPLHPKWTAYYYQMYRNDIPVHLSAYRYNEDWETNIEAVSHTEPDLIISSKDNLHDDERERLEKIAPVFFVSDKGGNWREQFQRMAQLLGVLQEANSWLLSYELKVKAARERLKQELKDETVLVMSIHKQSCYFCPTKGMRDVLYGDLQLNTAPGLDPAEYNQLITAEQIASLNVDRILLNVCQEPESLSQWQLLQSSPMWQDLRAVRKNQMYLISSDPWREYSAYACERIVEDVLKLLSGDHPN